jgi:hypothetical protein
MVAHLMLGRRGRVNDMALGESGDSYGTISLALAAES